MSYVELKDWFAINMGKLPKVLDSEFIYFKDVVFAVNLCIQRIDSEILHLGYEIKKSKRAKEDKLKLELIFEALQNDENWNKPLNRM